MRWVTLGGHEPGYRASRIWLVAVLALVICSLETGLRLGAASPDTRYTLPQFSLGYFWDTPLGWTGVVGGVPVNKDSVQFASLAGFFRDEPAVPVPLEDNVYTRFARLRAGRLGPGAADRRVRQLRAGQRRCSGSPPRWQRMPWRCATPGSTLVAVAGGAAGEHRASL